MINKQNSKFFWILFIIIIIAILAVLMTPNYGTLSILTKEVRTTQARNLAANLTASSAANYSLRKFNPHKGTVITNCKDVIKLIDNPPASGYQIVSQPIPNDKVAICSLQGMNGTEIKFSAIGTK